MKLANHFEWLLFSLFTNGKKWRQYILKKETKKKLNVE